MFSKSKLVAIICCLCLAVTSLVSASFLFNKNEKVFASEGNVGYYVQDGASVRFDNRISGLRYETVVTKEQYDAWTELYGAESTFEFHTVISYATQGAEKVDVVATGDITMHDFNEGDFVYKAAKFFDLTDNGEGEKWTDDELFEIYNSQWKAESYVKINGQVIYADSANNLRSMRSVALLNRIKETTSDAGELALLKEFTKNVSEGEFVELNDEDIYTDTNAYYYNNYADESNGITFELPSALPAGNVGTYVGANAISETDAILSNERNSITVKKAKNFLTVGESELFILDANCVNKVFVKSNVIDATEVFFADTGVERMQKVFALKHENIFINSAKKTETVTGMVDGQEETASITFYGVDRGYYVLGEDIDFAGAHVSHERNIQNAYKFYKKGSTGNYTDPDGFDMQTAIDKLTGFFGFGGTFDGNGHSITRFKVTQSGTTTVKDTTLGLTTSNRPYASRVAGLFGALAYGATIKDVAFTNINVNDNSAHMASQAVLAGYAGGSTTATGANTQNFLKIKYGTTNGTSNPSIVIDNCYFQYNQTQARATDDGNHEQRNAKPRSILREAYPGVTMFSNCVFDMANVNPISINNDSDKDGGYGIIGKIDFADANNTNVYDDCFSNCYTVSADRDGRVEPVWQYNIAKNKSGQYYVGTGKFGADADYKDLDISYDAEGENRSIEVYAKNDAENFGISHGDLIYAGLVGEENNETYVVAIPDEINGYTANKTAYVYENVYHYKNYTEMVINNNPQSTAGFSDSWVKVGGAVRWKTENAASPLPNAINVTVPDEPIIGSPVAYSVKYNGTEVDAVVNAYDDERNTLTDEEFIVDKVNKTFTIKKAGVVNVEFEYGNFEAVTESYTMDLEVALEPEIIERGEEVTYKLLCNNKEVVDAEITVNGITNSDGNVLDTANKKFILNAAGNYSITFTAYGWTTPEPITCSFFNDITHEEAIVVSANYLTEEGTVAGYSVPYEYNDKGELKATTYAKLYEEITGVVGASLTNVYTLTGETKAELNQVESSGYYYFANPGKATKAQQMVLAGDSGTVTLTNQTIITLVVEDENDFKYIPSDSTTRAGSYYLAKDFDNRNGTAYSRTNLKLSEEAVDASGNAIYLGYSFGGGYVESRDVVVEGGFQGLFDGLGHTISYLEVVGNGGLLGTYTTFTANGATLRNVKFDEFHGSMYSWGGQKDESGKKIINNSDFEAWSVLARIRIQTSNTCVGSDSQRIKLENVVIDLVNSSDFNTSAGNGKFERWSFFGLSDSSSQVFTSDKIALNNVILKYAISIQNGAQNNAGSGGLFDQYRRAGSATDIANWHRYQMQGVNNVYLISAPATNGRTAAVTSSSTTSGQMVGLPENDYDMYVEKGSIVTQGNQEQGEQYYTLSSNANIKMYTTSTTNVNNGIAGTSGWGTDGANVKTGNFIITMDYSTLTTHQVPNRNTFTAKTKPNVFFKYQGVYRYDDYTALGGAVSRVGSWAVAQDGTITWSPVA